MERIYLIKWIALDTSFEFRDTMAAAKTMRRACEMLQKVALSLSSQGYTRTDGGIAADLLGKPPQRIEDLKMYTCKYTHLQTGLVIEISIHPIAID